MCSSDLENIPRVLPEGCRAALDTASWDEPELFRWLARAGNVERREMYRTFNCGIGMVVCVPQEDADRAVAFLREQGETAWHLGRIETCEPGAEQVHLASGL